MNDPSATAHPLVPAWVPAGSRPPQLSRKRHHRFLTLPSSVLIVICMFLPTLQVCGKPAAPVEFPIFWTPYFVAALVFIATLVRPWRLLPLAISMRVVVGATVLGFGLLWLEGALEGGVAVPLSPHAFDPEMLALFAIAAPAIAAVVLPARSQELLVARLGIVAGLGSLLWFIALAADNNALFGAYVSVFAAVHFVIGCTWWWLEAHADSR